MVEERIARWCIRGHYCIIVLWHIPSNYNDRPDGFNGVANNSSGNVHNVGGLFRGWCWDWGGVGEGGEDGTLLSLRETVAAHTSSTYYMSKAMCTPTPFYHANASRWFFAQLILFLGKRQKLATIPYVIFNTKPNGETHLPNCNAKSDDHHHSPEEKEWEEAAFNNHPHISEWNNTYERSLSAWRDLRLVLYVHRSPVSTWVKCALFGRVMIYQLPSRREDLSARHSLQNEKITNCLSIISKSSVAIEVVTECEL